MLKPFFVWQERTLKKIHPDDVAFLYAEKNYTRIYLTDKTSYMVRATLSNTLKNLPPDIFIKTHRAFAISLYHIDHIKRDHLLIDKEWIPIGRLYYKSFMAKLNIIE